MLAGCMPGQKFKVLVVTPYSDFCPIVQSGRPTISPESRFYTCPSLYMNSFTTVNSGATQGWQAHCCCWAWYKKPLVGIGCQLYFYKWVQKVLTHCTSGAEGSLNGCLLAKCPDCSHSQGSQLANPDWNLKGRPCKYFLGNGREKWPTQC